MKQYILRYFNVNNSFSKYFARWYFKIAVNNAVLRLEIIGRIGNFSMPSRSESLWILAIEFSCGRAGRIYSFVLVNWSFDLILRKAFCTFLSIVFVWSWFSFWNCSVSSSSRHFPWLRYFNFEPSFKLRWRHARDLFGSQIPVSTWGFELLGNYFVCKGFAVQTLLRSLEFMIQINLEHDTIDNFSWSFLYSWWQRPFLYQLQNNSVLSFP